MSQLSMYAKVAGADVIAHLEQLARPLKGMKVVHINSTYVGGGVGWHTYSETADFAADDDDVSERFTGYHLLGGAEFRLSRWLGLAGEGQWTTVPDALGANANSVSGVFEETDLGGVTFRVKLVVGN